MISIYNKKELKTIIGISGKFQKRTIITTRLLEMLKPFEKKPITKPIKNMTGKKIRVKVNPTTRKKIRSTRLKSKLSGLKNKLTRVKEKSIDLTTKKLARLKDTLTNLKDKSKILKVPLITHLKTKETDLKGRKSILKRRFKNHQLNVSDQTNLNSQTEQKKQKKILRLKREKLKIIKEKRNENQKILESRFQSVEKGKTEMPTQQKKKQWQKLKTKLLKSIKISQHQLKKRKLRFFRNQHVNWQIVNAFIYIQSTENNTIVTLTDLLGNTRSFASGGSCGFQGSRRSTAIAAKAAVEKVAREAASLGLKSICIRIKGFRRGKKRNAINGLKKKGLKIVKIQDLTAIPHNGCRARKKRRK